MRQVVMTKIVTIEAKNIKVFAVVNEFRSMESVIQHCGLPLEAIESTSVTNPMPTAFALMLASQKMGTNVLNARVFGDHGENYYTTVLVG